MSEMPSQSPPPPPYPCRLWDLVPAPFTGVPQWYVLHAWAGSFQEMVASLVRELTPSTATEDEVKDGVGAVKAKAAALAVKAGFAEEEAVRGTTRELHDPLANIYVWLGRCMHVKTPRLGWYTHRHTHKSQVLCRYHAIIGRCICTGVAGRSKRHATLSPFHRSVCRRP